MATLRTEVAAADGQVIVFLDEIHTIVGAGAVGDNALDAVTELSAAMSEGRFSLRRSHDNGSLQTVHRTNASASAAAPTAASPGTIHGGNGRHLARSGSRISGAPQHSLRGRCAGNSGTAFGSLHRRPLSAGQGDRADRFGGKPRPTGKQRGRHPQRDRGPRGGHDGHSHRSPY